MAEVKDTVIKPKFRRATSTYFKNNGNVVLTPGSKYTEKDTLRFKENTEFTTNKTWSELPYGNDILSFANVEDMKLFNAPSRPDQRLYVADVANEFKRGGIFNVKDTGVDDGGITFALGNGKFAVRDRSGIGGVRPEWWGAKGNGHLTVGQGRVSDSAAFQAMFNTITASTKGFVVNFTEGVTYYLDAPVNIPNWAQGYSIILNGNECEFYTDQPIEMIRRVPTTQSEADAWQTRAVICNDISFKGSNSNAASVVDQTGIHIASTYGSELNRCKFQSLWYGAILTFCLEATVNHCKGNSIKYVDLLTQTGAKNLTHNQSIGSTNNALKVWPGATHTNSASNSVTVNNWRSYSVNSTDTTVTTRKNACIVALSANLFTINGVVSEGANTQMLADVICNDQGSTTVKQFSLNDAHFEKNSPVDANIKVSVIGTAHIRNVYRDSQTPLIDAQGSGQTAFIYVEDIPWVGAAGQWIAFNKGASTQTWSINRFGDISINPFDAKWWKDGAVPQASKAHAQNWGYNYSGDIYKYNRHTHEYGFVGYKKGSVLQHEYTEITATGNLPTTGTLFRTKAATPGADITITIDSGTAEGTDGSNSIISQNGRVFTIVKGDDAGTVIITPYTVNGNYIATGGGVLRLYTKGDSVTLTSIGRMLVVLNSVVRPKLINSLTAAGDADIDSISRKTLKSRGFYHNYEVTNYAEQGNRVPNASYNVGDTVYNRLGIYNFVYQCVAAGTVSANTYGPALTAVGQTAVDGTVTWRAISLYGSTSNHKITGYTQVSSNWNTVSEAVVGVNTSGARTITLSNAHKALGTKDEVQYVTVKDETGNASSNNITVISEDGVVNEVINTDRGYITLYSNGASWYIIDRTENQFQVLTDAVTTILDVKKGREAEWSISEGNKTLQIQNAATDFAVDILGCVAQIVTIEDVDGATYYITDNNGVRSINNTVTLPTTGMAMLIFRKNGNRVSVIVESYPSA